MQLSTLAYPPVQSFLIFVVCLWMLVLHLYAFHYGTTIENMLFAGLYSAMTYTALILFIKESISSVSSLSMQQRTDRV